ncbi:aminodeoxychorismate synthase component I [Pseudosulfitobacter sp. DSM 107133]|uniref:aminodeoxychorismate synthase component I n=1 Tax=Pseudosulfitobacter sp. DSM 107133 TaxID=2883100 RepID=UPI000DF1B98F|nr:aminodeoxychorismate synthase component I [Pseudosulfitobacter sp. DSM 107133]
MQHQVIFDGGPLAGGTAFADPLRVIRADTPDAVPAAFAAMEAAKAQGCWLAGYASYELGYVFSHKLHDLMPPDRATPLLEFGVFDAPAPARAARAGGGAVLSAPQPVWDQDAYSAAFDQIKAYIAAGDIYQANLTFPINARYAGTPLELYAALCSRQPVPHGAFVDLGGPVLLSRSPELFFAINETGGIEVKPMKGTVARGPTTDEDAAQVEWLRGSAKNQAENLMIVDLMRNDISRLAQVGSVRVPDLFQVETYATLHQMTSRIVAQLLPDVTLRDIFGALFPCGSITGAPKIRAMQILRALEAQPRGAYCGAIGWIAPQGHMQFNVAIRTVLCHPDGTAQLNVGGGVVHDSTAVEEYTEALLKSRFAF